MGRRLGENRGQQDFTMFLILLLFLTSLYFLNHAWPLLLRRPVLKLDTIKFLLVITLLYVVLTALWKNLIGIVWLYGFTLLRQSIGEVVFYLIAALSLACIIGMLKTIGNFRRSLYTSAAIVGLDQTHALPVLRQTLKRLALPYRDNITGISLLEPNVEIAVALSGSEMRLRVAEPLDKLLLNKLCRTYLQQYQTAALPIAGRREAWAMLFGLLFIVLDCFLLIDWLAVTFFGVCPFICFDGA